LAAAPRLYTRAAMRPLPGLPLVASVHAAASRFWLAAWQVAVALRAPALALLGPGGARVPAVAAGQAPPARAGGAGVEGA
jgi:hypothetical protein